MPYIKEHRRIYIDDGYIPEVAGELNYLVTKAINTYIIRHGLSYQICNDIVGALENAKDEFQRRIQHPYEDKKIEENGDVYQEIVALLNTK